LFDWINDAATAPLAFSASSEPAAAAAAAFAGSAGRTSFRIGDRPGLVLLRTLCQLANTAADAAADQVADENGIDIAMRHGANYPFGLFAWADDFGRARVAEVLANIAAETGEPLYAPSAYFERSE
jgi:3-hydroxybutyryl-CoA dehydrogenase